MWYDNIVEGIVENDIDKVVEILEDNTDEIKRIMTNFKLYYLFYKTKSKEMVVALLDYFDVKNIFDITLILTSIINIAIMHDMDIEMIKRLVDRGGNINNTDVRHVSPLLQCIKSKRNVNFVKEILKMGANVNEICDKDKNTILHLAVSNFCSGDDIEIIKLLVDSGADINAANSAWEKPLIKLPLNVDEDLWLELIKRIPDIDKYTEMHLLYDNFLTTVVSKKSRIKQFIDIIIKRFIPDKLNKVCNRFLYLALKNNCSVDCITEIIDNGASVNELKYLNEDENDYSIPPLLMALQLNRGKDIISVLIDKGANVNSIGELGVTPLLCAINNNYKVEIIDKLINFEADVNNCDFDRVTPLMYAIKNGDFEVISRLIKAEADVNAVDMFGRTSLCYAVVYFNDYDLINLLIKKGANFSEINDCHDRFWFSIEVVEESDDKFFAELIPNRNDVNIKDEFGQTFLMYALELSMNKNIIFNIIRNGADINATDNRGYTPLIYAIKYECDIEVINKLIKHGADVNVIDNDGLTPLKHAVHSSTFKEIIQILLDNGVNINTHDENNNTVLLYILKHNNNNNNKELVSFVIHKGADVNICDNAGLTPLMYAILYSAGSNKVEIATLLIKNGAFIDVSDVEGHTALYYALSCENINKCLHLLIDCGASVPKCIAYLGEGKTHLIYSVCFVRDVKIMIEFLQCVEDISEVDKCGTNYLNFFFTYHVELAILFICDHIDFLKNDAELIEKVFVHTPINYLRKLLFCCGLDINLLDKNRRTLLINASYACCDVKLIKEILENGGNPNLADCYLDTALHYTVLPEPFNLLVVYGNADVSARNDYGEITCKRTLCDLGSFNPRCIKPFTKHVFLVLPEELDMFGPVKTFYSDFLKDCRIELNKMKSVNIVDNLSFFKFCCKLSKHDMNLISESDNFCVYSEEQIERLFPIYFDIIIMKIKKCKIDLSKRQLINSLEKLIIINRIIKSYNPKKIHSNNYCSSVEHLDQLCECVSLNYDIIYCISKYLCDRHIVNLLLASY